MVSIFHESKNINPRLYDHPFFGQFFLDSFQNDWLPRFIFTNSPSSDIEADTTVKILYSVPRILMGLLAIVDTYLVIK